MSAHSGALNQNARALASFPCPELLRHLIFRDNVERVIKGGQLIDIFDQGIVVGCKGALAAIHAERVPVHRHIVGDPAMGAADQSARWQDGPSGVFLLMRVISTDKRLVHPR